jgi:ABC-type sugar transport system ATPase subunit
MASVTLRQLTKTFHVGGAPALFELSLEVADGEFLVLLGPSGCGKTTALRCIAGLEEPTGGEVWIGDHNVTDLPPAERDVAMVFQNYALYPHLSVRDNIAFPLTMRGMPKVELTRRVRSAAERLGVGELLDRRPAELSGGQRQRVALGRAIVREPRVFLFDEPLSNLDAQLRVEMRAEILRLHRTLQATMIYVTHDQIEAMTMGQRIAVLHEGRLRQAGTPAVVYGEPADLFTARFIGSPGMNVIPITEPPMPFRLRIPRRISGAAVHAGVRPEHLLLTAPAKSSAEAVVRMIEPLGAETLVHLEAAGQSLVARVPGIPAISEDARVGLRVEAAHLHYFDAGGARLA